MHIHKESQLNILFIYELWAYIMGRPQTFEYSFNKKVCVCFES